MNCGFKHTVYYFPNYEKFIIKMYLVEVHEVAGLATERDEEPHSRLTLFNLRLSGLWSVVLEVFGIP